MNKNLIISLVVLAVLGVGGYILYQGINNSADPLPNNQTQDQPQNQGQQTNNENNLGQVVVEVGGEAAKTYEIMYTNSGYSPASLTIKAGDTVTFKNQSSGQVWTGSAMHPSHTVYSGTPLNQHCPDLSNTSFDQCKSEGPGTSWSFTFTKKGNWGYHNHVSAGHFGKIIVE